jgi:circadian clock protein KaiC
MGSSPATGTFEMREDGTPRMPERIRSGAEGLDEILGGGLFRGGTYIVFGRPGAGKTILANQACFQRVREGERALYVTLLAETHGRMLAQLGMMSFFDPSAIGDRLFYLNGFTAIVNEGLAGLLALVQRAVRDHEASLLILDGMVTAEHLATSSVDYKRFINELQTWTGMLGCTVVLLTSGGSESATVQPEHTMVDGIFELRMERQGARALRLLSVSKFRGSAYLEGQHTYAITSAGVAVYPRPESLPCMPAPAVEGEVVSFGIKSLDALLGGGIERGSTTLVVGPTGSGKTILGLHFLSEGVRRGEKGVYFGFYETPAALSQKAERLGIDLDANEIGVLWQPASERLIDPMCSQILSSVRDMGAKRLFIDGLAGFRQTAFPERIAGALAVLRALLAEQGVTTLVSDESPELFSGADEVSTQGVSPVFENILLLRHSPSEGRMRRFVAILKARDGAPSREFHEFEIADRGIVLRAMRRATKRKRGGRKRTR